MVSRWAGRLIPVILSLFVMVEVNYPLLQPTSRLALFALLGLLFLFLCSDKDPRKWGIRLGYVFSGLWAVIAVFCFAYIIVQTEPGCKALWAGDTSLGSRAGQELPLDYAAGFAGLIVVLIAARRSVGITLPLLALVFLLYARYGAVLPDWLFPHRGYPWSRIVSQTVLHSQGVLGIALKVMFTYVFPFVLFGAFLEATGGADFIIGLSHKLFYGRTGAPAKVAVLSSGLMGSLSGSAVANTALTGTFTIPMMRRSGFQPHLAAGIEAAASSGGALMPPIMGAGAYMMLEIITPPVTYLEIIKAALIPAILYYVALLLVVHFYAARIEAKASTMKVKVDTPPVPKLSLAQGLVFLAAFVGLIAALLAGYTPFRSVTLSLGVMMLTAPWSAKTRLNLTSIREALRRAATSCVPLVAAASCVGIILGVVTLTGIGSRLPGLIVPLAQDNLLAALFMLMVATIILGMGLPSSVCYLLMATFVGPVLTRLGLVPLAAHLFIFYFGMMAMVTPPVALAAFTAAAIAEADIVKSSMAAFRFALIGFFLPYAFVLNPSLLLLSDGGALATVSAVTVTIGGIYCLAAGTTGFCFSVLKPLSRIVLFAAALALLLVHGTEPYHLGIKLVAAVAGGLIVFSNSWTRRIAI
jgi:TRAP transporter 4TM/12TM fusion protein